MWRKKERREKVFADEERIGEEKETPPDVGGGGNLDAVTFKEKTTGRSEKKLMKEERERERER